MGSKARAPEAPDYSGIAAASERSAELSFQLGQEQLQWARDQYANDSQIISRVVDSSLARQDINDESAAADRARYEGVYQPLEDDLVRDAQDYASPQRQEQEMGRASATVADQFQQARLSAARNLEAYGVDPTSTRYAALDSGSRVQQAAAQAGAANQAQAQTEAVGRALRSEAINVGRGYPGQVAGTYATALQSGASAANSALAGTASGASTMGTGTQWNAQGNSALGTWGNTVNMGYQNQLGQYNANQQSSSGLGGLLGTAIGGWASGGFALAEGGMMPEGAAPPAGATSGGNVPAQASPSGGRAVDDVNAALTAGEFVVPKDVVSWKGEEFFQKLIDGSRSSRPQASAQPQPTAIPAGAQASFVSRPQAALQ